MNATLRCRHDSFVHYFRVPNHLVGLPSSSCKFEYKIHVCLIRNRMICMMPTYNESMQHAHSQLQQAPSVAGVLPPHPSLADYYVEIQDGDFVLGCNTFPISGWNMWEIMEMGAGVPQLTGSQLPNGTRGPEMLTQIMDDAVEAKFTVVRGWAHGVAERYPTYINGTLNEGLFKGLDFALHEARKRGIRVSLS